MKESPQYKAVAVGSSPHAGGACTDLEMCAKDLAEESLRILDSSRLLNYYIKQNTTEANKQILELYQNVILTKKADDLVAWGNAYYGLLRYPEALQKYEEALSATATVCPAHIGAGLVFFYRPHGSQPLSDLQFAENEFRSATQCDQKNAFAKMNLCSTLVKVWANATTPDAGLLTEAKAYCDSAIAVDPRFFIAARSSAYILYRQGQVEESFRDYESLIKQYPTDAGLFVSYGFLLYLEYLKGNSIDLARAVDQTQRSWNLDSSSYLTASNLGFFYYEQGDNSKAVDFWRKANLLNADEPDSLAGLALGLFKLNQQTEAFASLASAIRLDANYKDPTFLKARANWSDHASSDLTVLVQAFQAAGSPVR